MFRNGPMPVLDRIKQVFQAEFGNDFSKLPNRDNTLFVIIQHGFISIRPMMEAFLELGIHSDQVFMTTKPHTTPTYADLNHPGNMLEYFKSNFKHYIPFQWTTAGAAPTQLDAEQTVKKSRYKVLTDATHDKLFEDFCSYLIRYPDLPNRRIENIIICDEGGKFLSKFIERYHRPSSTARRNLNDYHVVAIEHTKCGTYRPELNNLPFPLINMADSYLKTQIESQFIAESMFVHLNAILQRLMNSSSMIIGVVGGGNIGKEVLVFLSEKYSSIPVIIFDRESDVLPLSEITALGWGNVKREATIEAIFLQATVILGCTGKDFMERESKDCFVRNPARQIHLVSCSSGDTEFNTLLQQMPGYKFESLKDIRDYSMPIDAAGEKLLTLYNGGFPMNFLIEQPAGVPVEETVPLCQVQITRSMKLAAIVQALKLLEVTSYFPKKYDKSLKDYMKLEVIYQWEIAQAFYHHLMTENSHTQLQIANGSMGVHQPTMSSVLNIPYYITTNHQVEMQHQLLRQEAPIKILVIHGTTGSGKTTLAQHYLQKHRMQHPEHLTRTIAAETALQWRDHLRAWAEELFPELRALLIAETNPQRQESMIDQRLQAALSEKEWCIVIDNWDQDQLFFKRIEDQLLGSNVGKGILLITTQGESPYADPDRSLDLSLGLTAEESQKLLIKVMNLEKTNGITWQQLGTEAEFSSLTEYLNRLPLALVVAGSYLLWENKSLPRNAQTHFTYSNYKNLLELQVTNLIRIHKEKLGKKGDIPREESEEFIRIKTQEAAVDLSLKKAIKTDSSNPNMNLWHMLCFCGFLASDGIPQQLLTDHLEQISNVMAIPQQETFDKILSLAQGYSLLQYEHTVSTIDNLSQLHIHRVIQHVLRDKYWPKLISKIVKISTETEFSTESIVRETMAKALLQLFSPAIEKQNFEIIREFLPHIEMCFTHWRTASTREILSYEGAQENLQGNMASAYHLLGNNHHAKHLYCELLDMFIKHHRTQPAFALAVARTQQNLAGVLIALGEYREGLDLYQVALAAKMVHCDEEMQVEVATTQQGFASALSSLGLNDEAEPFFQKALSTLLIHCKPHERIKTAITQQNFANTLSKLGRNSEAIELYTSALSTMREHHRNEEHIEIAETKQNLAIVLARLGQYENAVNFYQESLPVITQHYGIHGQYKLALTQRSFANALFFLKNYIEAENWYNTAISTLSVHHSTDTHIEIAEMQLQLAQVLMSLDRGDEAETLHESTLRTIIDLYGPSHLRVAMAQYSFVLLVMQREKIFLAFTVLEQCEKAFGALNEGLIYLPECYQLKEEINNIIVSLPSTASEALNAQDYETAITVYENLILLYPSNANYCHNCACAYHLLAIQQDKIEYFDKAQQYFEGSLRLEKRISTQVECANFLRERGCYAEAIALLDEALMQPRDSSGGLSYGPGEASVLPLAFSEKIKTDGEITIRHPQFFAYFLKIQCFLAQQSTQSEVIITCLRDFIEFAGQFKQNYADSYLSIYDWFLKNSCEELSEKQSFLAHNQSIETVETNFQQNSFHIASSASELTPGPQANASAVLSLSASEIIDERGESIRLSSVVSTLHSAPRDSVSATLNRLENRQSFDA